MDLKAALNQRRDASTADQAAGTSDQDTSHGGKFAVMMIWNLLDFESGCTIARHCPIARCLRPSDVLCFWCLMLTSAYPPAVDYCNAKERESC
jgi:hypothetical protein